jgi:hypothetical protein
VHRVKLKITNTESPENRIWDDMWRSCEYATYYQSREWAEIWSKYSGGQTTPSPVLITYSDGKKALLPLSRENYFRGLFSRFTTSIPSGRPGGWISCDQLGVEHAELLFQYIQRSYPNFKLNINPLDNLIGKISISKTASQDIHVLTLNGDYDALYKRFSRKQRGAINKANRAGIIIRPGISLDDWRKLYSVYNESVKRWGERAVEVKYWKLYEYMFFSHSPNMKLWLAEYQNEVIGGMLVFFSSKVVSPWTMVTSKRYFSLRPSSLLYATIIKYSCDHGYRWIDFGKSGKISGLIKFKERFGAVPINTFKYEEYSSFVRIIKNTAVRFLKR